MSCDVTTATDDIMKAERSISCLSSNISICFFVYNLRLLLLQQFLVVRMSVPWIVVSWCATYQAVLFGSAFYSNDMHNQNVVGGGVVNIFYGSNLLSLMIFGYGLWCDGFKWFCAILSS